MNAVRMDQCIGQGKGRVDIRDCQTFDPFRFTKTNKLTKSETM